jgi:hypothetical protein
MSWPRLFWLVVAICLGTGSGIDRRDTSPAMTRIDGRKPVTVRGPGWRNLLSRGFCAGLLTGCHVWRAYPQSASAPTGSAPGLTLPDASEGPELAGSGMAALVRSTTRSRPSLTLNRWPPPRQSRHRIADVRAYHADGGGTFRMIKDVMRDIGRLRTARGYGFANYSHYFLHGNLAR